MIPIFKTAMHDAEMGSLVTPLRDIRDYRQTGKKQILHQIILCDPN